MALNAYKASFAGDRPGSYGGEAIAVPLDPPCHFNKAQLRREAREEWADLAAAELL